MLIFDTNKTSGLHWIVVSVVGDQVRGRGRASQTTPGQEVTALVRPRTFQTGSVSDRGCNNSVS